jgi:uncharacterized protein YjbJ (UPF0337 family)
MVPAARDPTNDGTRHCYAYRCFAWISKPKLMAPQRYSKQMRNTMTTNNLSEAAMEVVRRNSEEMRGDENSLLVNHSFERAPLWNVTFRHALIRQSEETIMVDKDRVEGSLEQAKGKVKEVAGKVTGDTKTEAEGKADQVKGR